MVAAMVFGGLRRCEVLGLQMEDLRVGERRVFTAKGKGLSLIHISEPTRPY